MASSTNIPITSDNANRVIRFNEKPKMYIPKNAAINDIGTEIITINPFLKPCKNNIIINVTNIMAFLKSSITDVAASIVNSVVSLATIKSSPISSKSFSS